eukprot:TRINITY_DN12340_c1_g1_i1.p1 TRINITY_DN12340_c1_g1~~TRINITY_DN12340_c1_g1_i1.p1  ORF type:complete len:730 (+),score=153.13 TRINITY_DN12340_c1_g1_i1:94-2190(+)
MEAKAQKSGSGVVGLEASGLDYTPLQLACVYGHLAVAEMLLSNKADLTVNGINGTPLHSACDKGHRAVVEMLIGKGADVMAKDDKNGTPLHQACRNGRLVVAKMLLDNGADVEAKDLNDVAPLHLACQHGHLAIAEMLLNKGAVISAKTKHGETPLHFAARSKKPEVAAMLIGKGADIHAASKADKTPLDLCLAHDLRTAGTDVQARLSELAQQLRLEGGPSSYESLVVNINRVTNGTFQAELSVLLKDMYHEQSEVSLAQRAELTILLLGKLQTQPPDTLFKTRSEMLIMASELATTICNYGEQARLLERPSKEDADLLNDMITNIKGHFEATEAHSAATNKLQKEAQQCDAQVRRAKVALERAKHALRQAEETSIEKHQALESARQQLKEQQQADLQAAEITKQKLVDYKNRLDGALAELYQIPVSQLNVEQTHALVCSISNTKLDFERFQEQAIDGAFLADLTMTELEQMTGLTPLGFCHRVVHCAQMAAAAPQTELLRSNFDLAVEQLSIWLEEHGDPVGIKYREQLANMQVDILTCYGLDKSDLKDLSVAPHDRRQLLKLLEKASFSATQQQQQQQQQQQTPVAGRDELKRLEPDEQRRVLDQVLEGNPVLAERLQQQLQSQEREVPDRLLCPITMDLMVDPVLAEDGRVYDREAIATWLRQTGMSPMTRQPIGNELKPVMLIKNMVEDFHRQ